MSLCLTKEPNFETMKRIVASAAAVILFATVTILSNSPLKGDDNDRDRDRREADEIQIGFSISPVRLDLRDKDPELVGLGSYIVNAQGGCNDCHTCPSYAPGHNPFPAPFGVSGDGQINGASYLAGGITFRPATTGGGGICQSHPGFHRQTARTHSTTIRDRTPNRS